MAELERPPVLLAHAESHVRGAGAGGWCGGGGDFPGLSARPKSPLGIGSAADSCLPAALRPARAVPLGEERSRLQSGPAVSGGEDGKQPGVLGQIQIKARECVSVCLCCLLACFEETS